MKSNIKLACVTVLMLLFGITSCDKAKQPEQKATAPLAKQKTHIALVMKTLTNPFFVAMEKGAREAEKEFGIQLVVKTAAEETSINQQIDIVNQLVRDNQVSAIVIAPGDSVELIPVLKTAQDKGIKVVNIDNQLDPEASQKLGLTPVPFISVDNEAAAYLSAKYISDKITSPTNVAILEGIPSASNAQARKAGAVKAFSENPNITVVASKTAHWKVDEGYEVTKSIFEEFPDIGALFCANDMMAIGAIQYLTESARENVQVAAFDAIDEAKSAIKERKLAVSIDQLPARQGYVGVKLALDLLNGQTPPPETFIDVSVIDAQSLQ